MSKIKVGLIGLSASATGTGWAASAHLPYLLKSPHYEITALCNSSIEAAQKAVEAYKLSASTKTYGSPEDLANDPNVDLVVANTRVDKHAQVLLPSLRKGKDVFCEWPLDKNAVVAREMLDALKEGGGKGFVGLQARQNPYVRRIKSLVEEGRIGKVLSSTVVASAGNGGGEEGTTVRYFTDRSVGGHMGTIQFGHSFDYVLYVLGELKQYSSFVANQRPSTKIIDRKTNTVVETVIKNSPDQILIQGQLASGTVLSYHLRGGKPIPSQPSHPGFLWCIYGEKGEIAITGERSGLNVMYEGVKIVVHDQLTDNVEEVVVEDDAFDELPWPARNIGRLYEAFANGESDGVATFESAVKRHVLIDEMYRHWDNADQGRAVL